MAVTPEDHAAHTSMLGKIRAAFTPKPRISPGIIHSTIPGVGLPMTAKPQVKGVSANLPANDGYAPNQHTYGVPGAK